MGEYRVEETERGVGVFGGSWVPNQPGGYRLPGSFGGSKDSLRGDPARGRVLGGTWGWRGSHRKRGGLLLVSKGSGLAIREASGSTDRLGRGPSASISAGRKGTRTRNRRGIGWITFSSSSH